MRRPRAKFALGYAPDSWNALLNRFGAGRGRSGGDCCRRDSSSSATARGGAQRRFLRPLPRSADVPDPRLPRAHACLRRPRDREGEPKYLNSPETPLFHKGRELYGLYEARQARTDFKRLMVVEGYMDVVRLHQAGITYAVATLGTATTQEHLQQDLPR